MQATPLEGLRRSAALTTPVAEQAVITATSVAKAYAVLIDRKGGNEQEGYFSRF